jgi:hypothetical protein
MFDQDLMTDAEFLAEIGKQIDQKYTGLRTEFQTELRALKQRMSRPPGSGGGPERLEAASLPLLASDQNFKTWLSAPRGKSSTFTTGMPFTMERRAQPIVGAGGTFPYPIISGPQQPALRLVELLPQLPAEFGGAIEYARETGFTPSAAVVAEGALKPASDLTFAQTLAHVQTIATHTRVSVQSLRDVPSLQAWIDARLGYAVQLAAEGVFLNAAAPDGLIASASPLDPAYAPAAGGTQLDIIGAAISQLESSGYTVDGLVLNGVDVAKARLLKTTMGEFVWADPDSPIGTSQMWSVPVIKSPAIAPGTWLVGAFAQTCILFSRQQLTIEISFEDQDNFVKNLATIRAEERAALAIAVPHGLITGTFSGTAAASAQTPLRK